MSLAGRLTGGADQTRAPAAPLPTVDAGPDDSYAFIGGNGYELAGSGSDMDADYTWSQHSGPGTATFVDATDPESVVNFDEAGTYVLQLLADDGQYQVCDRVTITVTEEPGERVLYWYEVPAADSPLLTLAADKVVSLAGKVDGTNPLTVASAPARMAYSATGGPNNQPAMAQVDPGTWTGAAAPLATGTFVGIYAVTKLPTAPVGASLAWQGTDYVLYWYSYSDNHAYLDVEADSAAYQEADVGATPAGWVLLSVAYEDDGIDARVNNTPVGAFTGDTGCGDADDLFVVGEFAFICAIENRTATDDAGIRAYLAAKYGL